jgi:hypothetical protein
MSNQFFTFVWGMARGYGCVCAPEVPPGFSPLPVSAQETAIIPSPTHHAHAPTPAPQVVPQAHQRQFSLPENTSRVNMPAQVQRVPPPRPVLTETATTPAPVQRMAPKTHMPTRARKASRRTKPTAIPAPDQFDETISAHLQTIAANQTQPYPLAIPQTKVKNRFDILKVT